MPTHRILLQVLSRQIGHGRLIYLVLAECRLILSEAKAPQPDNDVHDGRAHNRGWHVMAVQRAPAHASPQPNCPRSPSCLEPLNGDTATRPHGPTKLH